MSELVKLVNEWDSFEKVHPHSTIEDFCRHYLITKREQEKIENDFLKGRNPPEGNSMLAKTIGRMAGIMHIYLKIAYRDEKDIEVEWAFFLNSVYLSGECRKTDVINYNFTEPSTGIDILNRLKKAGFITERDDPDDKRAKLVKVTPKGEEKVFGFFEKARKMAVIMFSDINEDDKRLMIQLLNPVEAKQTRQWPDMRNKSIDEILDLSIGKEKAEAIREQMKNHSYSLKKGTKNHQ